MAAAKDPTDGLQHLMALHRAGMEREPIPPATSAWLDNALKALLEDGDPFDKAFGLRPGPGQSSAANQYRKNKRDFYLRRAWECCTADKPWPRSKELSRHVNTFESVIYPRWRERAAPPENASLLRANLFWARRAWDRPFPATTLGLHNICYQTETPRIHFGESLRP